MKKIIKYFAMFLLALVIIMSASRWNECRRSQLMSPETSEIEDIITTTAH